MYLIQQIATEPNVILILAVALVFIYLIQLRCHIKQLYRVSEF